MQIASIVYHAISKIFHDNSLLYFENQKVLIHWIFLFFSYTKRRVAKTAQVMLLRVLQEIVLQVEGDPDFWKLKHD